MKDMDDVVSEDRLFDDKIIELVEHAHGVTIDRESIRRRVYINNYEVDVVATGYTPIRELPRIFIFELKESDLKRAIIQACRRSILGDYTYIVINHPVWYIVDYIIRYHKLFAQMLATTGVGIISYTKPPIQYIEAEPVLVRPAKWVKRLAWYKAHADIIITREPESRV